MAEAKGKSDISQHERLISTYTARSAKGTSTGGSLLWVDPWRKCHSAERLSQDVAAKVTKDKDLPVERTELMRAENGNIPVTSQKGGAD